MQTFLLASLSSVLLWLAFPPIGIWPLAWIGIGPLVWLVLVDELPGERPWWQLYWAGFIYWLVAYHFIRIPHWLLNFAWLALAGYFAIYTPLLIKVCRTLVHQLRVPAVMVVPIVWTGIEWMRSNFFTGMGMGLLSHSQYRQTVLIQLADISGAYIVSFLMATVAAGLTETIFRHHRSSARRIRTYWPAASAILALGSAIGYGQMRLAEQPVYRNERTANIALIQPSIDVVNRPLTDKEITQRFEQHRDLTWQARGQWSGLDLIVWPESSFQMADLVSDLDEERTVEYFAASAQQLYQNVAGNEGPFADAVPLLSGGGTHDPARQQQFNSAILFSTDGRIVDRYFKSHLVIFGEYIPFAGYVSWLNNTPIGTGVDFGTEFTSIEIDGVRIAPSICFESCVPRYIHRQVNSLSDAGEEPDVLLNVTNDGWFFGTSCLDLHLASNVFRAIEMRKPHLVCANTGFSAEIDSSGRILQQGPRRQTGIIRASVGTEKRASVYRVIGNVIPCSFALFSLAVLMFSVVGKRNISSR